MGQIKAAKIKGLVVVKAFQLFESTNYHILPSYDYHKKA